MPNLVDTPNGPRGTGLVPAPFNAHALRYRLVQDPAAVTIDWNASPSVRGWLDDYVSDQQQEGSCVAHAAQYAVHILRTMRGLDKRFVCRNFVYFWGRVKAGLIDPNNPATWADTGMWAEAGYDVILDGYPQETLDPYVPDWTRRPPDTLTADTPNQDDVLSHRGVFRDDPGGLAGGVILALQAFMPVTIGMFWIGDYSNPDARGFIPATSAVGAPSGHELMVWKRIPQGVVGPDWYAIARQSWGRWFTDGRQFPDPDMEAGDFLIPGALFENGTVMDVRAASYEAVPQPEPTPTPGPEPTPAPSCKPAAIAIARDTAAFYAAHRSYAQRNAALLVAKNLEKGLP